MEASVELWGDKSADVFLFVKARQRPGSHVWAPDVDVHVEEGPRFAVGVGGAWLVAVVGIVTVALAAWSRHHFYSIDRCQSIPLILFSFLFLFFTVINFEYGINLYTNSILGWHYPKFRSNYIIVAFLLFLFLFLFLSVVLKITNFRIV